MSTVACHREPVSFRESMYKVFSYSKREAAAVCVYVCLHRMSLFVSATLDVIYFVLCVYLSSVREKILRELSSELACCLEIMGVP